jgi:3-hydroxymyristoyl/3-hydroxydecanoyl-(acyl carrier protein) dehydratase
MRYFLIDKVTEFTHGRRARGVKNITLSDDVLHDHFPDHPVMPGALIVEAMAQLGGFVIEMSFNEPGRPIRRALLVQIYNAKFHDFAAPGDQLDIEARLESELQGAAQIEAEAHAGGKRIARATLTFVLKEVASERVHEQRRYIYKLWTKGLEPSPTIL